MGFWVGDREVEIERFGDRAEERGGGVGGEEGGEGRREFKEEDGEGVERRGGVGVVAEEEGGQGGLGGRAVVAESLEGEEVMSLWMWGMSDLVARRILVKSRWPIGWFSGNVVVGVGAGVSGGAAAPAILVVERERGM